jgi:gliding motility-associated lipoprotein GldD
MNYQKLYPLLIIPVLFYSCREAAAPKPRAYQRIGFPEKEYTTFNSECNFSFEYPVYGKVKQVTLKNADPCWYDISFSGYNATIHVTYKPLNNNLSEYIEDVRRIVNKHIIKADDIVESTISLPGRNVYGLFYDISGNTASAVNFYITDSTTGFLSGSLYFQVHPNVDSLAPAISFFREDIVHLIQSFSWE